MSLHKLTPAKVSWIIDLGKAAAENYLVFNHPEVTDEERNRIVSAARDVVLPKPPSRQVDYTPRNNFMTAAWLNGVSFADIGRLFGVRRQTVSDIVDRALEHVAVKDRDSLRLERECTELKMTTMYEFYKRMSANPKTVEVLRSDPLTLTNVMYKMPVSDDEGSAYDQHDAPTTLHKTEPEPAKPQGFSASNFDWSKLHEEAK